MNITSPPPAGSDHIGHADALDWFADLPLPDLPAPVAMPKADNAWLNPSPTAPVPLAQTAMSRSRAGLGGLAQGAAIARRGQGAPATNASVWWRSPPLASNDNAAKLAGWGCRNRLSHPQLPRPHLHLPLFLRPPHCLATLSQARRRRSSAYRGRTRVTALPKRQVLICWT